MTTGRGQQLLMAQSDQRGCMVDMEMVHLRPCHVKRTNSREKSKAQRRVTVVTMKREA